MPPAQSRVVKDLFNYETTARTDFREGEVKPIVKTEYKAKPPRQRPPYRPVKYIETMNNWRKPTAFNNMIKLRPILQTNPWQIQEPYSPPEDLEREKVQRTRPRLVMTPSVSMDDIADPEVRKLLVNDMYQSTIMKDLAFTAKAAFPGDANKAPFTGTYAPAKPLALPIMQPPYVSTEWRMDSVPWDQRQLRSYCNVTRQFWLSPEHAPTPCSNCEESAKVVSLRKMKI